MMHMFQYANPWGSGSNQNYYGGLNGAFGNMPAGALLPPKREQGMNPWQNIQPLQPQMGSPIGLPTSSTTYNPLPPHLLRQLGR